MKENELPNTLTPVRIAKLSKTEIMTILPAKYAESKPLNDRVVDVAVQIKDLTAEIYRRSILKQLPGVPLTRTKLVMRIEATVSPNTGLPKIAQRLADLAAKGIEVVGVTYDENTGNFEFFTAPEFNLDPPPES